MLLSLVEKMLVIVSGVPNQASRVNEVVMWSVELLVRREVERTLINLFSVFNKCLFYYCSLFIQSKWLKFIVTNRI